MGAGMQVQDKGVTPAGNALPDSVQPESVQLSSLPSALQRFRNGVSTLLASTVALSSISTKASNQLEIGDPVVVQNTLGAPFVPGIATGSAYIPHKSQFILTASQVPDLREYEGIDPEAPSSYVLYEYVQEVEVGIGDKSLPPEKLTFPNDRIIGVGVFPPDFNLSIDYKEPNRKPIFWGGVIVPNTEETFSTNLVSSYDQVPDSEKERYPVEVTISRNTDYPDVGRYFVSFRFTDPLKAPPLEEGCFVALTTASSFGAGVGQAILEQKFTDGPGYEPFSFAWTDTTGAMPFSALSPILEGKVLTIKITVQQIKLKEPYIEEVQIPCQISVQGGLVRITVNDNTNSGQLVVRKKSGLNSEWTDQPFDVLETHGDIKVLAFPMNPNEQSAFFQVFKLMQAGN